MMAAAASSSGMSDRPGQKSVNPYAGITIDRAFLPACIGQKSLIAQCIWSASSVNSKSWLLFGHQLLSSVLSTEAHAVRVGSQRRTPHRMQNPKGTMTSLFRQHRGWRYVDVQHATAFARCLQNLDRLLRCATFRRFAEQVTGQKVSSAHGECSMNDRTRAILEDLEAVRENLLALSDDIWAGIDRQDLAAFDEGVRFMRSYVERMPEFDRLAADLSASFSSTRRFRSKPPRRRDTKTASEMRESSTSSTATSPTRSMKTLHTNAHTALSSPDRRPAESPPGSGSMSWFARSSIRAIQAASAPSSTTLSSSAIAATTA